MEWNMSFIDGEREILGSKHVKESRFLSKQLSTVERNTK